MFFQNKNGEKVYYELNITDPYFQNFTFSKELQQLLFDRLEKTLLDNKKQLKAWVQLLYLYFLFLEGKRFLLLSLKIKKSIR